MVSQSTPGRPGIMPLLSPAIQIVVIILLFVTFTCPDPFHDSGISMMIIQPVDATNSSASSATNGTIVFGGGNSTSATTNATATPPLLGNTTSTMISRQQQAVFPTVAALPTATGAISQRDVDAPVKNSTTTPVNTNNSTATAAAAAIPTMTADIVPQRPVVNERINTTAEPGHYLLPSSSLSSIEIKYGPLGGCYRNERNKRTCTPASLSPNNLDSLLTDLSRKTNLELTALPDKITQTFPILHMTSFLTLFVIFVVNLPVLLARLLPHNQTLQKNLSPDSPLQKNFKLLQYYTIYVRILIIVFILITSIALRLQFSKDVYAFNTANASIFLPSNLLSQGQDLSSRKVSLKASIGPSFGILWSAVILLIIETFLERRRLKREEAILQARKDIEGQYGRDVFQMLEQGKSGNKVMDSYALRNEDIILSSSNSTVGHKTNLQSPPPFVATNTVDMEKAQLMRQLQESTQRQEQLTRQLTSISRRMQDDSHRVKRIPVPASAPVSQPDIHYNQYHYDVKVPLDRQYDAKVPLERTPSYRTTEAYPHLVNGEMDEFQEWKRQRHLYAHQQRQEDYRSQSQCSCSRSTSPMPPPAPESQYGYSRSNTPAPVHQSLGEDIQSDSGHSRASQYHRPRLVGRVYGHNPGLGRMRYVKS
ncbi:unnamed protein product [Sympodiomycopsis kandeliae]